MVSPDVEDSIAHEEGIKESSAPEEDIKDSIGPTDILVDLRSLDGMSPAQEICNAISMLAPSIVCLVCWFYRPEDFTRSIRTAGIFLAVVIHLPFSVAYYILLARRKLHDAIDNTPRKLDQTSIHVAWIITTWSLTINAVYSTLCTLLNFYFIFRLWCRCPGALERMANISVGALGFCITLLLRGDSWNFLWASLSFSVGGCATLLRLGGWGRSITHLSMGGLVYHCILSASKMQGWEAK
eukprot:TRINITY_DN37516_c0_g1_i1.p1 TRINITY_DN37516_c0_g1~~TRINITY_DN37516_c0_g1_i1.p1  ORF type:complete len:240 (+),score=22.18 TRINITY_DN37516_c0_g1_i1:69-788(+)